VREKPCLQLNLPALANHMFVENWGHFSSTSRAVANFQLQTCNSPNFRYHGNRGRLSRVRLTPLNGLIPKTPYCVRASLYSHHSLVIALYFNDQGQGLGQV